MKITRTLSACLFVLFLAAAGMKAQTVSNLGGTGSLQFFNDDGSVLTTGMVYIFQAQTTTPVAVYVDSSGVNQQPNPVPLGGNGRTQIWLASGTFVKIQLCSSNTDGAFCSASHVLFSADNILVGSSGGGGGGSCSTGCSGFFISSTASPATSGVLRLASGDSVCWRNAAGSNNLCIKKDSNDLFSLDSGSWKLPEVGAPSSLVGVDIIAADNSVHRFKMYNNGAPGAQIVASGNDISTSDAVTAVHFGANQVPFSSTVPSANQFLQVVGGNIAGTTLLPYTTPSAASHANIASTTMATAGSNGNEYVFYATAFLTAAGTSCTGSTSLQILVTYTDNVSGIAASPSPEGSGSGNTSAISQTPLLTTTNNGVVGQEVHWFPLTINAKANSAVAYSVTYFPGTGCSPGPSYYVLPILQQVQ